MSNSKPKVGFYWCGTCGGCEESVVDLAENILDVVAAVDIVFWPVATDFKKSDVEAMPDGSIAVSFINGAIRNSEDVKICKLLRQKSGLVIAYGACAHMGGIPGLANFWNKEAIFERVYHEVPTIDNPNKIVPLLETEVDGVKLTLPEIYNTVRKLDDIIP
ncbi:MAG: NADH-quinone oxidoreductase subunit B family protein, partial [Candidatus Kariarchaeaceae archaeon]